jgi:dipeptidyl aminopeptidase/acylaminoacyl peptidase
MGPTMNAIVYRVLAGALLLASSVGLCEPQQPLSPAQALAYTRASDLHFSPDGSRLAYVAISYRWDGLPRVRLLDLASGNTRELTAAGKSERSPQWSPDGKTLAFLSNRGGKTQVYTLAADKDEAQALTTRKFGVTQFHWSPDGHSIAYLAKDDDAPEQGSGPQVADFPGSLAKLWVVGVASGATRTLGPQGYRIDDFQWQSPGQLLISATDRPRVEEFTSAIYSVSATDGTLTPVSRPPQPFEGLLASPDGSQFAVRASGAGGPAARDLFVAAVADGALRSVSTPPALAVAEVRWYEKSVIWMRVVDGFYNRIVRVTEHAAPVPFDPHLSVAAFDVSPDGALAFVGEDFTHLPQIYVRTPDGRTRQVSQLQDGWQDTALAPTTIFRTKSFDGTLIEAALMRPVAAPSAAKLPLVLLVHGGPASSFAAGYGWQTAWAQLLAAHGYQVLMVNARGSNGYSEEFVKANRGDWGGGDYKDLMSVLDAVIARGATDPARLGIGGWSYGGEMAAWAITQTDRFKAAVDGAGVFDQQAEFETEEDPAGDEWYFGTPWEHPEVFARNSPATYIRNARTPTLILGGQDDTSNPVGQSQGLYRALKHFGVEAQMVLYPGEGHSPRRGSYNIDMFERILAWYDRYLKPAP